MEKRGQPEKEGSRRQVPVDGLDVYNASSCRFTQTYYSDSEITSKQVISICGEAANTNFIIIGLTQS